MAGRPENSAETPCAISRENMEEIFSIHCRLSRVFHNLQCCSARIKGSRNSTPCHESGEETGAERMLTLLSSVEGMVQKLKAGIVDHDLLLQRRERSGRRRDSAYVSGGIDSYPPPTQVQADADGSDERVSSSTAMASEATNNPETT